MQQTGFAVHAVGPVCFLRQPPVKITRMFQFC